MPIRLQNLPLPAAYNSWNNSGEKGFSCSIFPDLHSVSHSLSNHLLPAKSVFKNFIFASWFSALPFPSLAVPCWVLLRSWATHSSFQFQNLNSIRACCQNENGRISPMICCLGSAPVPALKHSEFTDRLAPSFTTIPYGSYTAFHHNVKARHITAPTWLVTVSDWFTDQVFQITFSGKRQREGWNTDKQKAGPRIKER